MQITSGGIARDFSEMNAELFFETYLISDYYWYFDKVLKYKSKDNLLMANEFKRIISVHLDTSKDNILLVGSGKIGYSLNPKKLFHSFTVDSDTSKNSDLDVAIISENLYVKFWKLFRASYTPRHSITYNYISREIYRGYINDRNINEIETCRREWNNIIKILNRKIKATFYIQHDINYRIYRNFEDFKEYNITGLELAKKKGD